MNWVWDRWQSNSYIARLIGLVSSWSETSWLLQWSDWLGFCLIFLTIICAPLGENSYIGILLLGITGFWLLLTLGDDRGSSSGAIERLVLLYWIVASLATAFSPVKEEALAGWVKLSLYLGLFALGARVLRSPKLSNWLIGSLLHTSLWVSVYAVRQQLFGAPPLATWNDPSSPLAQDTRVYSYLGNPNLLASYLLPAIGLGLAAIVIWQRLWCKLLAITITITNVASLYFTDSRGGWIALLVLLMVFGFFCYYWWYEQMPLWWRRWSIPLVLGAMTVVIALAFSQSESLRLRLTSIFAGRGDSSNNFRLNVWAAVWEMIKDYPWLGIGPGNRAFNQMYPLYMRPNFPALGAYSIFLEMTVEMGILGIGAFLALVTLVYHRGKVHLERLKAQNQIQGFWIIGSLAALSGLLAHGLFDIVWYRPQVSTLWWLLIALIASYDWSLQDS